jgi:hypothetical protein
MDSLDKTIGDYINSIGGFQLYQGRPEILNTDEFPIVTFKVETVPEYVLESEIGYQKTKVTADIWAETPTETGEIVSSIEAKLRTYGYLLVSNLDIPDPEGYSHRNVQFIY